MAAEKFCTPRYIIVLTLDLAFFAKRQSVTTTTNDCSQCFVSTHHNKICQTHKNTYREWIFLINCLAYWATCWLGLSWISSNVCVTNNCNGYGLQPHAPRVHACLVIYVYRSVLWKRKVSFKSGPCYTCRTCMIWELALVCCQSVDELENYSHFVLVVILITLSWTEI